jgi:hypothetical protein
MELGAARVLIDLRQCLISVIPSINIRMQDANLQNEFFKAIPLERQEARRAYPLVRLFHPALSLDQWLHYAQTSIRKSSGLLTIQDSRGYIHAAFTYSVDGRIARGPVLRVTELMVGRLPGNLVNHAIMDGIERLAGETGSEAIEIFLPSAIEYAVDPAWRAALMEAGFSARTTSMIRRLAPIQASCKGRF